MSRTLRVSAAACAALALALPAQAGAATAPVVRPAAATTSATGFVPVADAGFAASQIASPSDGTAYVAGVDNGAIRVRLVTRTATGATVKDVVLPRLGLSTTEYVGSTVSIAANGGRTYLLAGNVGFTGPGTGTDRLFSLSGTTATELSLPTSGPSGARPRFDEVAVDGPTSVWVSGSFVPNGSQGPAEVTYHGNGSTWTMLPVGGNLDHANGTYAYGGHYYENTQGPTGKSTGSQEWTGSQWVSRGLTANYFTSVSARYEWTFASTTDFTRWGYTSGVSYAPAPLVGDCEHVVTDGSPAVPCVAPAWPVSAAVRLANGSVVLGGSDTIPSGLLPNVTSPTPSAFAVVPKPGATPVTVPGSTGGKVIDLAAATTGSLVWALTPSATGGTTIQTMGSPAAATPPPVTKPRPRHNKPKPATARRHASGRTKTVAAGPVHR